MQATVRFILATALAAALTAVLACTGTSTEGPVPSGTEPRQDALPAAEALGEPVDIRFRGLDSGYTDRADFDSGARPDADPTQ